MLHKEAQAVTNRTFVAAFLFKMTYFLILEYITTV